MLDPYLFRFNLKDITKQLSRRSFVFNTETYLVLENRRKAIQAKTQELQSVRNKTAKSIGQEKVKGKDIRPLLEQAQQLGTQLKTIAAELAEIQSTMATLMESIPNILDESVPAGNDETDNIEISRWGALPKFTFKAKNHIDLGVDKGLDFALATKITSARFVVIKGHLARLQRAIIQMMLNTHTLEHNYTETYVPFLVNSNSLYGTGQLPKFADDLFKIDSDSDFYLIPTAEVPITNLVRDTIIKAQDLPLKFTSHTPCFRSEAGAYGRDVKGMIRQHQFEKVELVQIVTAKESTQAHEELTIHAESILQKLELPYRKVLLCAGDTGFSSSKTYDLEVWLPGLNQYREISSCSNFTDFQARRMQARWRNTATKKTELVHTINGSGLAVGRTLVAIMENYQDVHGNICIPKALKPYMGDIEYI